MHRMHALLQTIFFNSVAHQSKARVYFEYGNWF